MTTPKPPPEPSPHDAHLDALEQEFHGGEGGGAGGSGAGGEGVGSGEGEDQGEGEIDRVALRATNLGRRLAQRRGYAIGAAERKPKTLFGNWALLALGLLGAWSLAGLVPDLRYWLSSASPLDLGKLGSYRLEGVTDGAYVKVDGIASPRRGSWSRFLSEHEIFPLIGSRILVDRSRAPDPAMKGFGFRYAGEGRASLATAESRWAGVREQFAESNEVSREGLVIVIEDGVAPRKGLRVPLEALAWLGLLAGSVGVLVRRARARG